ncbi:MAG: hypothetical protein SWC96_03645 [Thermodesulfobacteriota bacterium]|nr:hypothetical protein [Thermodesulfobacteriota bacterium]
MANFRILILFFFCMVVMHGCSSNFHRFTPQPLNVSSSVYYGEAYASVWDATLAILEKYPILLADEALGIITTDYVPTISYENMLYSNIKKVTKYGYFAYTLFGHDNVAVVVSTEAGSPAYCHLFPGDIILNYNKEIIAQCDQFAFKVLRNSKTQHVSLTKKTFPSSFAQPIIMNSRMRLNLRIKKITNQKTQVKISIMEEQLEGRYDLSSGVLSVGTFKPTSNKGYKESLFYEILHMYFNETK